MTILFAWATPVSMPGIPVDHTWVTDFDNRTLHFGSILDVFEAGYSYWFCWGSYHGSAGTPLNQSGLVGSDSASLQQAQCLVLQNAKSKSNPPAQGTIFNYGRDGVCHQLANQVLWATTAYKIPGQSILTVAGVRGYAASSFFYGTYGKKTAQWLARKNVCASRSDFPNLTDLMIEAGRGGPMDEFERMAAGKLGDSPKLGALLALRSSFLSPESIGMEEMVARLKGKEVLADALNARNNELLQEAAKILGDEDFERVFGFSASETINLVDPAMLIDDGNSASGNTLLEQ
jgi:hypothetical protein